MLNPYSNLLIVYSDLKINKANNFVWLRKAYILILTLANANT